MPQFVLDLGTKDGIKKYNSLDWFTQGYIEAMFFTEEERLQDGVARQAEEMLGLEEGESYGDDFSASFEALADRTLKKIVKDCEAFQTINRTLIDAAIENEGDSDEYPYDEERAGADFWFDRNGYGVGFRDRGLGDVGNKLSEMCGWRTEWPEVDLYLGDNGMLYM